ncbi:MAG TPA: hypothetical protein VMP00_01185, partial [Burkholderiales bacterium]|nr:hypothetical protein [Burkholderiales bacterium]
LENPAITEASGLARSSLENDRLWVINDGGSPPVLYAIGTDGSDHGSLTLEAASNIDWEAIASFELDGKAWLLIADTGDNEAARRYSTVYVVEEPTLDRGADVTAMPAWTIRFRWPEGPLDCEAVAVDAAAERILLLSKRSIPAVLYELPLRAPDRGAIAIATRLGAVQALPPPTADDLARAAPERNWHWQPTAMDIVPGGDRAVILTYRAVYHFTRAAGESWLATLQKATAVRDLAGIREAEAVAFSGDADHVHVTVEAPHPPLYRIRPGR